MEPTGTGNSAGGGDDDGVDSDDVDSNDANDADDVGWNDGVVNELNDFVNGSLESKDKDSCTFANLVKVKIAGLVVGERDEDEDEDGVGEKGEVGADVEDGVEWRVKGASADEPI